MTTRLRLYNSALTLCGERHLASLTEEREPRRLLDHVWDDEGVKACLEAGQWTFARRTMQVDYDADFSPEFGYQYAFNKPTDWCNTAALCSDEYFNTPLLRYADEIDHWYADVDVIYVKYTSDHADYGNDLSTWPQVFTDFVAAYFAKRIILKLTSDENRLAVVEKAYEKAELAAKNHNAMGEPTKFPAQGGWTLSRQGGGSRTRDRGNRNNLIG